MFENKTIGSQNTTPSKPTNPDPNNLTIHTMKKDLADPSALTTPLPQNIQPSVPTQSKPANPSLKTTSSPFLTLEAKRPTTPDNTNAKPNTLPNKINPDLNAPSSAIKIKQISNKKPSSGKRIAIAVTIILLLLLMGGGGYYYWLKRKSLVIPQKTPTQNISKTLKTSPKPVIQNIVADKPNYLSFDFDNSDNSTIKKILQDYAAKVAQSNATVPVAFIVTDSHNNPVAFQDFAAKIGLNLPQNLIAQLGPGFTLYMYNDTGNIRIGLAVAEKNDAQLKAALDQAESSLLQDLQPLFLASAYNLNNNAFQNSTYNGIAIRFNNIISPVNLSVDYAIYQNQWLIGTTKKTLRSMIDLLNSQSNSSSATNAQ